MVPMQPLPPCWEQKGMWVSSWEDITESHCVLAMMRHWLHPSPPSVSQGIVQGSALPVLSGDCLGTEAHRVLRHPEAPLVLTYLTFLPQPDLGMNVEGRKKMLSEGGERFWH